MPDQPTRPDNRAALRKAVADAIRNATCTGNCGKPEEQCAQERIQPFAWHHGTLAVVEGSPEQFADAVLPVLPPPADRAAVLHEAADRFAAFDLHAEAAALRRMADETPAAEAECVKHSGPDTKFCVLCLSGEHKRVDDEPAAETDEERADREETERDHARGDHTYCGITCEIEMPTEHLRNFVIAKGYPGTKGALAELERRARTEQPAAGARQDGPQ